LIGNIQIISNDRENLKKRIVPLDISGKIFRNFATNDKFLIITIIQLYKLLLQCKEAEIITNLAKPLDAIIDYFIKNCKNKTNLLHSSLLEVFVLIMKEELLPLLNYIVTFFGVYLFPKLSRKGGES